MGRSSGGAFDAGVGSAFSSEGSSGPFDRQHPHHDDPFASRTYYDSYWSRSYSNNDQMSWRGGAPALPPRHREGRQCGYGFVVVVAFVAFFLSMWMLFGLYGSQQLHLGLNYSRLITANSAFVKEIKIQNLQDPGPEAYSFSKRPALSGSTIWTESNHVPMDGTSHKEWAFWLNKGSSLNLAYDVKGSGHDSLVLAILTGEGAFEEWKTDPRNPSLASKWARIHGKGSLMFNVDKDDDYYVAVGNLDSHKTQLSMDLKIRFKLYGTQGADKVCNPSMLGLCSVPLSFFGSKFALLTSPQHKQFGVDTWEVKVSYVARWVTYLFLLGLVASALFATIAMQLNFVTRAPTSFDEQAPLLPSQEPQTPSAPAVESYPPSWTISTPPVEGQGEQVIDDRLCSVCLDAPKDSFFDPCGHSCACYSCGLRIKQGERPVCPICRQNIHAVRKIYYS